jgi:hypothetical protein
MSSSSACGGSAPGREYRTVRSRTAIRVGMEEIGEAPASSGWASVSTLPKTMSGWDYAAAAPYNRAAAGSRGHPVAYQFAPAEREVGGGVEGVRRGPFGPCAR